jgi:hypothetical protein
MQIFDWDQNPNHTPMTTAQIQAEAPHEDAVWGAYSPSVWNGLHPGMIVSRYILPVGDDSSMSHHDLTWWQQNHPTWILYACDSSGNPTHTLAWPGGNFQNVPLDFSNPQVIQYQIQMYVNFLKGNGYNTLAADNTDLLNYTKGGGEFNEPYVSSDYGCGTWSADGSTFTKLFGPGTDPAFISAMVNWVKSVGAGLHQAGLKLLINHPLNNNVTNANEQALLSGADGMIYENGFTFYGKYQSQAAAFVRNAIPWAQYTQQHGIAFLITDYLCNTYGGTQAFNNNAPCPFDPMQIPAPQVDWALATYALVNYGGADVYISPQTGETPSYRPEYSTTYGSPCSGTYTNVTTNVYERTFSGALAIVNASTASYSFTLPQGHTYRDIEGRAVTNPLVLQPADAYFLLTSNGCS